VLDEWFEQEVRPRLRGRAFLIRSADDVVMGFTQEGDARRVREVLPKRFGKYGLTIHPDKTRFMQPRAFLSSCPLPLPEDWLDNVNAPQTEDELAALRCSVQRVCPQRDGPGRRATNLACSPKSLWR
jgi:hypothetical protein